MPSHSMRALLCGVLLVPLAWIGIVLFEKLHGSGALVPVIAVWGLVVLADLTVTLLSVGWSRQHRINRTPEPRLGRR